MALYLGSSGKRKIILNGVVYRLNLFNVRLLSSDNYILTDSNGTYLIPQKDPMPIIDKELLSSGDYATTD